MLAIGAIKQAVSLSLESKMLRWLSFALLFAYFFLDQVLDFFNIYLVEYLPAILYFVLGEIILITTVQLLSSNRKITVQDVQTALGKYGVKAFFLLIVSTVFVVVYVILFIFGEALFSKEVSESTFTLITFLALSFVFLLPYYFSLRLLVLRNVTIWYSVTHTIKLYFRRFLDTIILSSFMTLINLIAIGLTLLLALGASALLSHQIMPLGSFASLITRPLSPFGIFLACAFLSFSMLIGSSLVTIYFQKLEELGEFDE